MDSICSAKNCVLHNRITEKANVKWANSPLKGMVMGWLVCGRFLANELFITINCLRTIIENKPMRGSIEAAEEAKIMPLTVCGTHRKTKATFISRLTWIQSTPQLCYSLGLSAVKITPSILSCRLLAFLEFSVD